MCQGNPGSQNERKTEEGMVASANDVYVARQPIFDRRKRIFGYELLFRDGTANVFPNVNGDKASSELISSSLLTIGLERLTGGKRAFVNFTEDLLVKKVPSLFSKEVLVVEVLENVLPTECALSACRALNAVGYTIALDDFVYGSPAMSFLPYASLVKMDFRSSDAERVGQNVKDLSSYPVKFLAEKVETPDDFAQANNVGFNYFQGFFFSKPHTLKARDIASSKANMALLQIMAEANNAEFEYDRLETLIKKDVSLSYKLLRYINSAYFRRVREISSIRQAMVMLGEVGIRRFIALIAMAKLGELKPEELTRTSIVRARFCEQLSKTCPGGFQDSELFTMGLFSLIDAILDQTMGTVMKTLPLSESIKVALVRGEGELGGFIELVRHYEAGNWQGVLKTALGLGIDDKAIPSIYVDALGWADSLATA
jgi:EAL and modified HD-GYP domain-containing signal transduction protein